MPEPFHVVEDSPEALTLELGSQGLDGEASELWDFVISELASGRHAVIRLEAADAAVVSLEGIGVLVRLLGRAREAGVDLTVVSFHPTLERKLRQTGIMPSFERE